jgi:hypothetical protein
MGHEIRPAGAEKSRDADTDGRNVVKTGTETVFEFFSGHHVLQFEF